MGRVVLVSRLAVRDLRRRYGEAALLMVAILVAATTMTIALLLHGESAHPYTQTRAATSGPDVVASVFPLPNSRVSSAQLTALDALNRAAGVVAHSGPYPVTWVNLNRSGHIVGAEVEGRDTAPAAVDQPALTSGTWVHGGGAVVERTFAQALGVHVGDTLTLGRRQGAQAQTRAGGTSRRAVARRQAHQRRARRAVLRRPLHRLPRRAARWRAEAGASSSRVSSHVFVDESKRRGYLLVESVVVPGDLDPTRRMLRGLVLPGQRRLHM